MLLQGKLDDTSMQRGRDMDCLHKSSQGAVCISLRCLARLQRDIKLCNVPRMQNVALFPKDLRHLVKASQNQSCTGFH